MIVVYVLEVFLCSCCYDNVKRLIGIKRWLKKSKFMGGNDCLNR